MAYGNPSPLVVEFETKFFFKIWFNVMIYVEAQAILRFESTIFRPKHFFIIGRFIRKYNKFQGVCFTLGDALKIFFCLFHQCLCPNNQKSLVELDFLNFM